MDNSQEMNHPSKIDPPQALGFLEKANNLEEIVQSLSAPPSSFSPPSFSHDDAELRGRVCELEQRLQHATGAAREAESRAERAENLLAAKLVDEARKDAEISELTRANDDLKRERDDAQKVVKDTRKERSELAVTNEGLRADNTVLVELMKKGNETKRVLTEEIESLKQEMAEMRKPKSVLADDNGSIMQQLAEMGIGSERVAEWVRQNQEREEKQRKKSAHRGTSKNRHGSAEISVKTLDPSKTALTEEERYGNEQEVVCEGCVWKKVNGQWTVTVGKKDEEPKVDADIVEVGDDIDKMIEEMIKEKKRRIDSGIDEF